MSHVIYTVQMNNLRAAAMADIQTLDITVKTGLPALAPTWDMVWGIKTKTLSELSYQEQYERLMAISQVENPATWRWLLAVEEIALVCYCPPGAFCHRHLLKDQLMKLHHQAGDEVIDGGELLPEGSL